MRIKKFTKLAAATTIGALALTSCGGGGDAEGTEEDPVELRFAWWGSEDRNASTQEIIEAFEEENPGITVEGSYNDWTGYQDQLATQVASGDGPDIVQLDDEFISEYADRGSLLELTDVDTSNIDPAVVEGGQADGTQYAIPTGVNALVMMANPQLFEEAGVEIPDDTTWTWDDYLEISETIHEETGAYGTNKPVAQTMMIWLRQHDKSMFTEDGGIGFNEEDAEEYFTLLSDMMDSNALASASELVEEESANLEAALIATNQAAMGMSWTNQLPVMSEASGNDLIPLRFPSPTGNVEDNGLWFKNTMLVAATASTDYPEEAQMFIDFMVNSEEAGQANLMDRGLPSNADVRESVIEQVEGQDLVAAEFVADLDGEITDSEVLPPVGFTGISDALTNRQQDVYFDRATPAEAAESFVTEVEDILANNE
ncbi:ABC transporter substrate-binding protein [Nesterenkonia halotolerans]|uniref:Multiple sugar transport system substrate-binding protein n=1 Tax=Nesterenkonia halotolerans TaxID=225325 RepID=A0ABR9J7R0_9MICC|nr:ABC transporter substrate-binding protein [Nesterenkonia halotolerans]MBE1515034.1 multiple sugar transport system substrate-binding protein [Nesterenkonia halotolerans]